MSDGWTMAPSTLACGGCHDSDAAQAHAKAMTWDPAPADPFGGDESESCRTGH